MKAVSCVYIYLQVHIYCLPWGRKKCLLYRADWSWCLLNFSKLRFSLSTHWCVEWSFSCTSRTLPVVRLQWELCFGDWCVLKDSCRTANRCFPALPRKHMGCGVLAFRQRSCDVCCRGSLAVVCESAFCWNWDVVHTAGAGGVPSHSSLLVGLDIYILTFLLNTSKNILIIQFCEVILFSVFSWLNASAVLTWQSFQLFSTSFSLPQMVQLVPGKQIITFFCVIWPSEETESRSLKQQAQTLKFSYVNVFFKPLE